MQTETEQLLAAGFHIFCRAVPDLFMLLVTFRHRRNGAHLSFCLPTRKVFERNSRIVLMYYHNPSAACLTLVYRGGQPSLKGLLMLRGFTKQDLNYTCLWSPRHLSRHLPRSLRLIGKRELDTSIWRRNGDRNDAVNCLDSERC